MRDAGLADRQASRLVLALEVDVEWPGPESGRRQRSPGAKALRIGSDVERARDQAERVAATEFREVEILDAGRARVAPAGVQRVGAALDQRVERRVDVHRQRQCVEIAVEVRNDMPGRQVARSVVGLDATFEAIGGPRMHAAGGPHAAGRPVSAAIPAP